MTQLNLSGRQSNNTQQKPVTEDKEESIKNQTVGALGALAMFAAVIVIGSCSRSSKPVAVQQPTQPAAPVSAPAVTVPAPVTTPVVLKAKAKKRRAATLSYVNPEYGVSFSFPRNYQLKTGKEAELVLDATEPLQPNFVQAGGVTVAAVALPGNSYPGTNFKSAFVNVSVNPGMTSEACAQFALPETTGASSPVKVEQVKIGDVEFNKAENSAGSMTKQADTKYFHTFGHGTCYEFALGIGTDTDGNIDEITPVDREQVFGKLEKILATVKLQPGVTPEAQTPAGAVATTTPVDSPNTLEHASKPEATAPNF